MTEAAGSVPVRTGEVALVVTTLGDRGAAERFVRQLVEERLIACGNIVPGVLSLYRWEGAIARDEEVFVVMKAAAADTERLFARAADLHPYDVPELIELPVAGVEEAYCRWVLDSTEVSA